MKTLLNKVDVKDAGVNVLSETAAFWTKVKNVAEQEVKDSKNSILLNEALAQLAAQKLKEAK